MLKHSKACRADPDLLPQLAPQALLIGFPSLDVAPDHVPHPRTSLLLRAAAPEQDASLSHQHSPDKARPLRHAPVLVSRARAEIRRAMPAMRVATQRSSSVRAAADVGQHDKQVLGKDEAGK